MYMHISILIMCSLFKSFFFRPSASQQVQMSNNATLLEELCIFFEFPVSALHHPVHELLSRPSSSPPLSLSVESHLLGFIQLLCHVLIISIKELLLPPFQYLCASKYTLCLYKVCIVYVRFRFNLQSNIIVNKVRWANCQGCGP